MIWLAILVATWAVFGAGRQVGRDARQGITAARRRAAAKSAAIRGDKRAPKWKRRTVTAAHYTGKMTGATARGGRSIGRSVWTGAKWGVSEGRKRHAERDELRAVQARPDDDGTTGEAVRTYRETRDRVLHDRAERRGRGVPERRVRRIARRDARADERRSAERATTEPEPVDEPPGQDTEQPSDASPDPGPKQERADTGRYAPMARAQHEHSNGSSNGGTAVMTAPTTNGHSGNGHHSGEATTISGARAAWGSFEHSAIESFDTAAAAEQEAQRRQAGAAQMLDTAAAAETDAKQQMAAAQTLAASLAEADLRDPQAVADAEAQQEQATNLAATAAELKACAEGVQAEAARQAELAQRLRALAEASQAHCNTSLVGLNQRNARLEAFMKD